jgi:hypothetical protein
MENTDDDDAVRDQLFTRLRQLPEGKHRIQISEQERQIILVSILVAMYSDWIEGPNSEQPPAKDPKTAA